MAGSKIEGMEKLVATLQKDVGARNGLQGGAKRQTRQATKIALKRMGAIQQALDSVCSIWPEWGRQAVPVSNSL